MPEGLVNLLSDRQQFLDLAKYLIEIAEQGPARAKELRPTQTPVAIAAYEKDVDHAGLIRASTTRRSAAARPSTRASARTATGPRTQPGSMPTSPRFASDKFKNGSDPYSLYQTLTRGYGMMAPQSWMVPRQKYDVIHYLREAFLEPHNPSQFAKADDGVPRRPAEGDDVRAAGRDRRAVGHDGLRPEPDQHLRGRRPRPEHRLQGDRRPPRPGAGGVSRGKHWAVFDHDTMRFAAAWTGDGFIDWNGIHFNGRHGVHPKLVGDVRVANPVGPGWADPKTGRFDDPRPKGRDGRPYGPLPRDVGAATSAPTTSAT